MLPIVMDGVCVRSWLRFSPSFHCQYATDDRVSQIEGVQCAWTEPIPESIARDLQDERDAEISDTIDPLTWKQPWCSFGTRSISFHSRLIQNGLNLTLVSLQHR
jgi:hypothetical protein